MPRIVRLNDRHKRTLHRDLIGGAKYFRIVEGAVLHALKIVRDRRTVIAYLEKLYPRSPAADLGLNSLSRPFIEGAARYGISRCCIVVDLLTGAVHDHEK